MNENEPRAWIGLGSNHEHERALAEAIAALERAFGPLVRSSLYASPCVNGGGREYWNLAAGFNTTLDATALRAQLKTLETTLGRLRGPAAAGRVRIDLDLLVSADADGELTAHDPIVVPHVLLPLAELLPHWHVPAHRYTMVERARRIDASSLRRVVSPVLIAASGSLLAAEEIAC